MNFEEDLPDLTGYVIYNLMIDFIESSIISQLEISNGKYYSLREMTNLILSFLNILKEVDLDTIKTSENISEISQNVIAAIKKIRLEKEATSTSYYIDSKKLGLFLDMSDNTSNKVTEPQEAVFNSFNKLSKRDISWLSSIGVKLDN